MNKTEQVALYAVAFACVCIGVTFLTVRRDYRRLADAQVSMLAEHERIIVETDLGRRLES